MKYQTKQFCNDVYEIIKNVFRVISENIFGLVSAIAIIYGYFYLYFSSGFHAGDMFNNPMFENILAAWILKILDYVLEFCIYGFIAGSVIGYCKNILISGYDNLREYIFNILLSLFFGVIIVICMVAGGMFSQIILCLLSALFYTILNFFCFLLCLPFQI